MLILTRSSQEAVMIGDDITIRILGIVGNQVRIGIDAPKEVPILREEIYLPRGEQAHQQYPAR